MATYRMVYGDQGQLVHETYDDVEVVREDGWTVLFRGNDAILRVRDEHVRSLDSVNLGARATVERPERARMTVADLMRPAVISVELNAHVAAAAYLMKKSDDTALVVVDDVERRNPIGIITDTDIARAVADGHNPDNVRLRDIVTRLPITVAPDTSLDSAALTMVTSRIRHLPVVADGRLAGIVDITDVCGGFVGVQPDPATSTSTT